MGQTHQSNLQLLYSDTRFAALFQSLDDLHTAASEGQLSVVSSMSDAELVGWLQEFVYTAEETITEIKKVGALDKTPQLRLVK